MQDRDSNEAARTGRLTIEGDVSEVRALFPQLNTNTNANAPIRSA
jgi:hypothetical protein